MGYVIECREFVIQVVVAKVSHVLCGSSRNGSLMPITSLVHGVTCQLHIQLSQEVHLVFEHYTLFALPVFEL